MVTSFIVLINHIKRRGSERFPADDENNILNTPFLFSADRIQTPAKLSIYSTSPSPRPPPPPAIPPPHALLIYTHTNGFVQFILSSYRIL